MSTYQLTSVDLRIHEHLLTHRVLTTTQLVELIQSPERTVRYRLERLLQSGHLGRTRPAAESGSAPSHWWLTTQGRRAVSAKAPPSATPKALFMAHAVATADLYIALVRLAEESGVTPSAWLRDEESWEEWSGGRGRGAICPDALLEAQLDVDGTPGLAHAFVEIDLGTMTQARLHAKVERYRAYINDDAWQQRHPQPPLLLILTTSEARAATFLTRLYRNLVSQWSPSSDEDDPYEALVAVCSQVRDPEAAVLAPAWRSDAQSKPRRLVELLAVAVRRQRHEEAQAAQAAAADAARQASEAPGRAMRVLLREVVGSEVHDDAAEEALRVLGGLMERASPESQEAWAQAHLPLVFAVEAWWRHAQGSPRATVRPPESVISGLRALRDELWRDEVDRVFDVVGSGRRDDRRLPRIAEILASGKLVDGYRVRALANHIDWDAAEKKARATYESERFKWVDDRLYGKPWYRRYDTEKARLEAPWNAEHLGQCVDCGLVRNCAFTYDRCETCGGTLATIGGVTRPPELADVLGRLQDIPRHGSAKRENDCRFDNETTPLL